MEKEPIAWITVNGLHIPIMENETKEEAVKNRYIALNKEEAEKRGKDLPKRAPLENITITKDNVDDKGVALLKKDSPDGRMRKYILVEGSEIRNAYAFCGKGSSKVFRDALKYSTRYGHGKPEEWQHCAGSALITNGKKTFVREIHWVQGNDGVIREAFIKFRPKGGK